MFHNRNCRRADRGTRSESSFGLRLGLRFAGACHPRATGGSAMRTIVLTIFVLLALGLSCASQMSAAPMDGAALAKATTSGSLLTDIGYVRRHGRTCYRKCYRE